MRCTHTNTFNRIFIDIPSSYDGTTTEMISVSEESFVSVKKVYFCHFSGKPKWMRIRKIMHFTSSTRKVGLLWFDQATSKALWLTNRNKKAHCVNKSTFCPVIKIVVQRLICVQALLELLIHWTSIENKQKGWKLNFTEVCEVSNKRTLDEK